MEIGLIILHDSGVDYCILNLAGGFCALKELEDETLQKVLLLAKVILVLNICNLEWVHGDWLLLRI